MSEEQNSKELLEKKEPCKNLLPLVVLSLFLSLAALSTSIYTLIGNQAAIEANKPVVISTQYDKGKSLEKAQETKKPVIVFFYTDWCGFCQRFAPTYHKISKIKAIKNNFAIAYVNCEKQENSKLMEEYGIQGFPTVFVIDKEGKRTQLDNNTFFNSDSVEVVSKKALELIGESK